MHLKVGDCIVHQAHGIGRVVALGEKRPYGEETRLYYEIDMETSTIWVPVEAGYPLRFRLLTERGDLGRYRGLLKACPKALDENFRKRQSNVDERLKQGTFQAICEIVRDLTALSWKRPLNQGDISRLRETKENLCKEWAASKGISLSEAAREIESFLLEARQVYTP